MRKEALEVGASHIAIEQRFKKGGERILVNRKALPSQIYFAQ